MIAYLVNRVLQVPVTVVVVTAVVFLLLSLSGDLVSLLLPIEATAPQREALRRELHLDEPLPLQYLRFLGGAAHGDFGTSLRYNRPALGVVLERLPASLELAIAGMALAILTGVGFGVLAAVREGSHTDVLIVSLAVFGQSMPSFWLGIMLMLVFAVNLHLLPTSGASDSRALVLPAFTLAAFLAPQILLLTRSSMLDVLHDGYITTARAKGLAQTAIIWRHAFINALNPVVASIGLQFGTLMGGAVITETVFAWPGIGRLSVEAIFSRDLPTVEAAVLVLALGVLLSNLAVDLANALVDPRIRLSGR